MTNKGKTLEQIHGIEKAKFIRENLKIKNTGKKYSNITKQKHSISSKNAWIKNPNNMGMKNKHPTTETILKMSLSHKNKSHSKEWNEKVGKSNKGKKRTKEQIEKNRISHIGKIGYWKGKKRLNMTGNNNPNKRPEIRELKRETRIKMIEKDGGSIQKGKHEKYILDELEKLYGCNINRNFHIIGYKPDGYIQELNLVIEVDEKHHFNIDGTLKEKDIIRQKEIEKELNCKFLRIKDLIEEKT
jgi:very-short-patch-repair endonuclease